MQRNRTFTNETSPMRMSGLIVKLVRERHVAAIWILILRRDPFFFIGPLAQVDQLTAFAAEWTEGALFAPEDRLATGWAFDFGYHVSLVDDGLRGCRLSSWPTESGYHRFPDRPVVKTARQTGSYDHSWSDSGPGPDPRAIE